MKCMINRELSWLKFNERVLEEANCENTPLAERLKFVSIFTSNLDEFFMVRVGSLLDMAMLEGEVTENKTGMTPEQQLSAVYQAVRPLYRLKDQAYARIESALRREGIYHLAPEELTAEEKKHIDKHFKNDIAPLLSPQIIDARHPFPHLDNKQLNIAVMLSNKSHHTFGIIPVPAFLPRVVKLPGSGTRYILMEDIIFSHAELVFNMYTVEEKTIAAVTRNADIDTDIGFFEEDLDIDFRQHMKKVLKQRARLAPVRLELQYEVSGKFLEYFCQRLKIKKEQIFSSLCPLTLSYVFEMDKMLPVSQKRLLLNQPFTPQISCMVSPKAGIIKQVLKKDILLSYPYESMDPFLKLIKEAANDKDVASLKITLYRIDRKSKLAEYLITAAENGKEVMVLMELRARFDEQNNIEWAQRLEEAGCRVIYGFDGYKVHSKICLITRKERGKVQYLTQTATGNYNEKTAKLYTDLSILTANPQIGADADLFFKNMSMGIIDGHYQRLWVAPAELKLNVLRKIDQQIEKVKKGGEGRVILKINSLTCREVMDKLIEASRAGVKVQLIVRGICCLLPGVPEETDNISVISIVGRFLEHSRIYCFGAGKEMELYISSADMMTRNLDRRVEIACPVLDRGIAARIYEMLGIMLKDNVKARYLNRDGIYTLRTPGQDTAVCSQESFMREAEEQNRTAEGTEKQNWRKRFFLLRHRP